MDNTEADKLLDRWGEWSRGSGIGYSSTNIIARIMVEGAGAAHESEFQGISMAEDVAQCEKIVTNMDSIMKRAVKNKYLFRVPNIEGCKRCHCSESTYKQRVVAAQWFVAGNMAQINT